MRCGSAHVIVTLMLLGALPARAQPRFTDVSASVGFQVAAPDRHAGLAVTDLDGDGCPELLVNESGAGGTRYLASSCASPLSFQDVTATRAPSFLSTPSARSIVVGDVTGDGVPDLFRNHMQELWFHRGGLGAAGWSTLAPTQIITGNVFSRDAGMNTEGIGLLDADGDGDLDLLFENYGIELWLNDGTGAFTWASPAAGLPIEAADLNGDFLSVADVDDDGDVDAVVRLVGQPGFWLNVGGGVFAPGAVLDAQNENKGDVSLCDFDGDADLDAFVADETPVGEDAVWWQLAPGLFVPGPRVVSAAVGASACGDVDQDGWPDLFLGIEHLPDGGGGATDDLLLLNERDGGFRSVNVGVMGVGDTRAAVLSDVDGDADLDVLLSTRRTTELWQNDTAGAPALVVRALVPAGPVFRDALGATAVLEACDGTRLSGLRELSGQTGRGTHPLPRLHFGLGARDPRLPVVVRVRFVGGQLVRTAVIPASQGSSPLEVRPGPDALAACGGGYDGGLDGGAGTTPVIGASCGASLVAFPLGPFGQQAVLTSRQGPLPTGLEFDASTGELSSTRWASTR